MIALEKRRNHAVRFLRGIDPLLFLSFAYLYFPIVLFFLTWVKLFIAAPSIVAACYLAIKCSVVDESSKKTEEGRRRIWAYMLGFILIIVWCLLSGLGGWFHQSGDWDKHNFILLELVNQSWPVKHEYNGSSAVMSYYIGSYLVPAAIGKFLGFWHAEQMTLLWSAFGLSLACLNFNSIIGGKRNGLSFLVTCVVLMLFGTFMNYFLLIYQVIDPLDARVDVFGHWLSQSIMVQYPTSVVMLGFAFAQFVPLVIAISLFMRFERDSSLWGGCLAPLVLSSTFAFVGLLVIMAMRILLAALERQETVRGGVLTKQNGAALLVICSSATYIACNAFQDKPLDAAMRLSLIDYSPHPWALVLFELSWLIWLALLLKRESKSKLMFASSAVLLALPLLSFGQFNDLCMRASMPSLLIFAFYVARNIIESFRVDKHYCALLVFFVVLGGFFPCCELYNIIGASIGAETRFFVHQSFEDFVSVAPYYKYQYFAWDSGLANAILQ